MPPRAARAAAAEVRGPVAPRQRVGSASITARARPPPRAAGRRAAPPAPPARARASRRFSSSSRPTCRGRGPRRAAADEALEHARISAPRRPGRWLARRSPRRPRARARERGGASPSYCPLLRECGQRPAAPSTLTPRPGPRPAGRPPAPAPPPALDPPGSPLSARRLARRGGPNARRACNAASRARWSRPERRAVTGRPRCLPTPQPPRQRRLAASAPGPRGSRQRLLSAVWLAAAPPTAIGGPTRSSAGTGRRAPAATRASVRSWPL